MKFFSKNSNYRVTLEPGVPADSKGRGAKSGLYVKFDNGVVDVEDPDIQEMLLSHPAYNEDFVSDQEQQNEFQASNNEPEHEITELEHGSVKSVKSSKGEEGGQFSPEMKDFMMEQATKIAKEMATDMAQNKLEEIYKMKKGDDDAVTEELGKEVADSKTEEDTDQQEKTAGVERPTEVKEELPKDEKTEDDSEESDSDLSASTLSRKNKDELKEFAEEKHGIELDTNNLKKQMIDNFFEEFNN